MTREVQVKISLKDAFSAALKSAVGSAKSQLAGLADTRTPSAPQISAGMIAQGNLLATAIGGIASGVTAAGSALVGVIGSQYQQSVASTKSALSAAAALSAIGTGIDLTTAQKIMDAEQVKFAKLAAKLPGSTADYTTALSGITDTLTMAGNLTRAGLDKVGTDLVRNTALLGQENGLGSQATGRLVGKAITGDNLDVILKNDVFENVPAVSALLDKQLSQLGKTTKDWSKLTDAQQTAILAGATNAYYTTEFLSKSAGNIDSLISTAQSDLFDPQVGLFGFLRKIPELGNTTVISELAPAFKQITAMVGELVRAVGLTGDPLVVLITGIRSVGEWASSVKASLSGLSLGDLSVSQSVAGFAGWLTGQASKMIRSLISGMDKLGGPAVVGAAVGNAIGQSVSGLLRALPGHVSTIAVPVIGAGLQFLGGLVIGIFSSLPEMALSTVLAIGGSIDGWTAGLISGVSGWSTEMLTGIASLTDSTVIGLLSVGSGVGSAVDSFVSGLPGIFSSAASSVGTGLTNTVRGFTDTVSTVFDRLVGLIKSTVDGAAGMLSNLPGVGGAIGKVASGKVQANYSGDIDSLPGRITMGTPSTVAVGTAYQGNLLEAINQESRMKPSGSSLVIANSSELIVPRDKLSKVTKQHPGQFIFSPTFHVNTMAELHRAIDSVATRLPRLSTV